MKKIGIITNDKEKGLAILQEIAENNPGNVERNRIYSKYDHELILKDGREFKLISVSRHYGSYKFHKVIIDEKLRDADLTSILGCMEHSFCTEIEYF